MWLHTYERRPYWQRLSDGLHELPWGDLEENDAAAYCIFTKTVIVASAGLVCDFQSLNWFWDYTTALNLVGGVGQNVKGRTTIH